MPIRNPFTRRQADEAGLRPPLTVEPALKTPPGFERVDTVGSKASSVVSVISRRSQDTGEYKMSGTHEFYPPVTSTSGRIPATRRRLLPRVNYTSHVNAKANSSGFFLFFFHADDSLLAATVVNDSGVYLPPSPTVEKEPSWPRRYMARTSTDTRSDLGEIEHFGISRESFDSYRRSFVGPPCLARQGQSSIHMKAYC